VVTHTFSVSGVYTVSLTVADEDGQTGTAVQEVQVS
jgi:PKD repeat protein